ncbi:PREDICTED: secretion-regulating guanine nucleotide exchange factor-like [Dinoponera quadriceps]|uniref:Secretion-regulating guanine nucleotide exchange factor-like n=1 Tax=Dinoponera quadriceps TaxID=609295 RepID=A0A6P3XRK9_DINQU|nr:PREDICTED: secretion-regulating guanine nucleotide exchange factor-like [Dinoponera quadriceps]
MSTYKLISWGANSHGQLGQDTIFEECVLPEEINLSECGLRPESVRKIVGGGGHTLILDADGCVYSCGWNDKGQTGVSGSEQTNVLTFRRLSFGDETVVDVCCGWDSSAALTKNGDLYLWGSNRYGQLGDNPSIHSSTSSPMRTVRSEKVKRISMGLRHTAVLTDNGNVLVCGANSKGQLGLTGAEGGQSRDARHCFTAVPGLTGMEDVACGEHHTVVTTQRGGAYTTYFFGDNKHGQAGLDPRVCARICPAHRSVLYDSRLGAPFQIHAGWSHTNILSDGAVYSWGRNSYGQLGRGKSQEGCDFWTMQRVENLPGIVQLSVGSEHNVALAEDGTVFCWGWNEHGNCGNGNTKDVLLPERLPLPRDSIGVLVGSGAGHSFAVIKTTN